MKLKFVILTTFLFAPLCMQAGTISGNVTDRKSQESLIGAAVVVLNTSYAAITDIDGHFILENIPDGKYTLEISYISYITQKIEVDLKGEIGLNIALEPDEKVLDEVLVTGKKNRETERILQLERQESTFLMEAIGAREMSLKGIGNVEEGVKKLTGISIADAGQLIVRGLGDRYSTTTLNGLPIASPNPDNKLIPLDLFPTAVVQNITVSKVYDVGTFADYSGAHIDIATKELVDQDFLNFSFKSGANSQAIGREFLEMNRNGSMFRMPRLSQNILDMSRSDFETYSRNNSIFNSTFEVRKRTALPAFGGNIGFGKNFKIGGGKLSVLASVDVGSGLEAMNDASVRTLEASGNILNNFNYDSYSNHLSASALGTGNYQFREADHIAYSFFYARNAVNNFMLRNGVDYEDHVLTGLNDVAHVYRLMTHQLQGSHDLGSHFRLKWDVSYGKTASEEPDRRQLMYIRHGDEISLFKLNQQETMRYFGSLDEQELVGKIAGTYSWNENNRIRMGGAVKQKGRNYMGTRFYYNLNAIEPEITDIFATLSFMNMDNIRNGSILINRVKQPKDRYDAGNRIYSGFVDMDWYPFSRFLVNFGVRYEFSKQWVNYADDSGRSSYNELVKGDFFPALNLKYNVGDAGSFRFAASRTVTRPSFIEMAPFLYQESYGAAQVRGYADLKNGYNYNFDIRYEQFSDNGDMYSVTAYYKHLHTPIERTQTLAGGSTQHSFRNAEDGRAAGLEVEFRKTFLRDFRLNMNATYMYTDVKLMEGGAYTNLERPLQGASPYLGNADLVYSHRFMGDRILNLVLSYNIQGFRIHAVGISGLGDVIQQTVHTLNFNGSYALNKHFTLTAKALNLLNRPIVFKQETNTGKKMEVEKFSTGIGVELGVSYQL